MIIYIYIYLDSKQQFVRQLMCPEAFYPIQDELVEIVQADNAAIRICYEARRFHRWVVN